MAKRHSEILKSKDNFNHSFLLTSDPKSSDLTKDSNHHPTKMSNIVTEDVVSINKENQTMKFNRRKNNDFIFDKQLRIKSYLRRRGIPFRRCSELDVQCETKSFHLQISRDIDEAVFYGSPELIALFLSSGGIKLSDLNKILLENKRNNKGKIETFEDDDNTYLCDSDEDFFDSVKQK